MGWFGGFPPDFVARKQKRRSHRCAFLSISQLSQDHHQTRRAAILDAVQILGRHVVVEDRAA